MADDREEARHPLGRVPLQAQSRRRWAIAGGVAVFWLATWVVTGSFAASFIILVSVAVFGVVIVVGLRALGITREHPWLQRLASRPWRDGRAVLNLAVRRLPDVFIVTPSGSLIAPDLVELQMNPGDLASLREWLELDLVSASATEAYEAEVAKRGARFAGSHRPEVYIVPDRSLPQGRYRLRRGLPAGSRPVPDYEDESGYDFSYDDSYDDAQAGAAFAPDNGPTRLDLGPGRTVMDGMATVLEPVHRPAIPKLRLVTGSSVAETTMSGARAGRGAVELELPDVPTVSRVHATFTFTDGSWWITSKGVNGVMVNGVEVSGKQELGDGDSIRWGKGADAPLSRVQIG